MKKLVLFALFIFCFISLIAQTSDPQWMIKDGGSRECNSSAFTTYSSYNPSSTVFLTNVREADSNTNGSRNDVFIIYTDSSCFNSRYLDASWDTDRSASPSLIELKLIGARSVDYLYLTNTYETDDPDACAENTTASTMLSTITKNVGFYSTDNVISTNHDIVKSKDVTVIIDYKNLFRECGMPPTFDLCFDEIRQIGGSTSTSAGGVLELSPSRVFDGTSATKNMNGTLSGLCLNNISTSGSSGFGYLNLKVPDIIPPALKGRATLSFYIRGCDQSRIEEQIRDSHDPNFVEVVCVSEVGGRKYAKYTISTYNESMMSEGALSLDFIPPVTWNGALPTSISSTTNSADTTLAPGPFSIDAGSISIPFNGVLSSHATATVTFCLELEDTVDLATINLQLAAPNVNYGSTPYPIHDFMDIYTYEGSDNDTLKKPHIIHPNVGSRPISSFADCGCGEIKFKCLFKIGTFCVYWWHIGLFLAATMLVFVFAGGRTIKQP